MRDLRDIDIDLENNGHSLVGVVADRMNVPTDDVGIDGNDIWVRNHWLTREEIEEIVKDIENT